MQKYTILLRKLSGGRGKKNFNFLKFKSLTKPILNQFFFVKIMRWNIQESL